MANVPLHLLLGDMTGGSGNSLTAVEIAVTADNPPSQTSVLASPYFPHVLGNPLYDFADRSWGGATGTVPAKYTDPVDPEGQGWHPRIWNHDRGYDLVPTNVSSITTGATTTITLSSAHGFTPGDQAEVLFQDIEGADGDEANGTWLVTFSGTHDCIIPLDSTSLTLTAAGKARLPQWFPFSDTISGLFLKGVTSTDRSAGGSSRQDTWEQGVQAQHGYEVGYVADAHDHHAPLGERAHIFQHPIVSGLSARASTLITAATQADPCIVTTGGHLLPRDPGGYYTVTVYGWTGNWAAGNGVQRARVIDAEISIASIDGAATTATKLVLTLSSAHNRSGKTEGKLAGMGGADAAQVNKRWEISFIGTDQISIPIDSTGLTLTAGGSIKYLDTRRLALVDLDSSAFGAVAGTGRILTEQRLAPEFGEAFNDLTGRLNDAKNKLTFDGDVGLIAGISICIGRRELALCGSEQARYAPLTPATVTTGFPTRLTFASPINLPTVASGRSLLQAKITSAGSGTGTELPGRWELVVVNSTTIDILCETTAAVTAANLRVDVGDAGRFFLEDLTAYVEGVRTFCQTLFSQTPTSMPTTLIVPRVREVADRDGTAALPVSGTTTVIVKQAIQRLRDEAAKIAVVDTSDLEIRATLQNGLPREQSIELGRRVWRSNRRLAEALEVAERGVRCIVGIGDSMGVGTAPYLVFALGSDTDYNGLHNPAARNAKIFDQRTDTNEKFTAVDYTSGVPLPGNLNTFQVYDGSQALGPGISLILERAKAYDGTTIYVFWLCVAGSAITDAFLSRSIDGITVAGSTVTISVPGVPGSGAYGHGRPVPGLQFPIELGDLTGTGISGLPAGRYTATAVDYRKVTIQASGVTGTYTTGGTITFPQPDWRKASADLWPHLEDAIHRWFASIEAEGHYPDVQEVYVFEGTNDALFGEPAAWSAEAEQFAADLRDLLTTRSFPEQDLAILWQRVRSLPESTNVSAGQVTQIGQVQSAQDALAAADSRLALFDLDSSDEDDREATRVPIAGDGIHTTPQGEIAIGLLANNAAENLGLPANGGALIASSASASASSESSSSSASASASASSSSTEVDTATMLATLNIAIQEFLANGGIKSYTVDGVTVTRENLDALRTLRDQLKAEIAASQASAINLAFPGGA